MRIDKVMTHDGKFHADEVFAIAILRLLFGEFEIIRSRDESLLKKVDFRIDIGRKYDHLFNDYDHHMVEGAGFRRNGIPYASCGLIWKHFGEDLCISKESFNRVDRNLIQAIDANDNGFSLGEENLDIHVHSIADIIDDFNPPWNSENIDHDSAFMDALQMAMKILKNHIKHADAFYRAKSVVTRAIDDFRNERFIILEGYCPWQDQVIDNSNALYVIFPSTTDDWRVRAVPSKKGSFNLRKPLPESWAGKYNDDFVAVTGVKDGTFCHPSRFIAGSKTREGAIELVKKAILN